MWRFAIVLGLTAAAHADRRVATADELPRDEAPAPVDAPASDQIAQSVDRDAASDRAFGLGTALIQPMGAVDMALRSALDRGGVASLAAGFGHGLELSVDGGLFGGDAQELLGVGIKIAIVRRRTWAAAIDASVHQVTTNSGPSTFDTRYVTAGARLTSCVGQRCNALVTVGLDIATAKDSLTSMGTFDQIAPLVSGSLLIGTGTIRPMVELAYVDALYGFVGARFGGHRAAFDAGAGFIHAGSETSGALMLGLSIRP